MTLRKLPEARTFDRPQAYQWDAPSDVLERWAKAPVAAAGEDDQTITIFDQIGEDFWTGEGVTAKRVAGALRAIGPQAVTVKVNSPGGDMFEGIAIYNLLRAHPAKVTVEVVGWAASAASIIAMAGDEIVVGLGGFIMVHNAWGMVVGNRHDMRTAADLFDGFDAALADIYEARTGMDRAKIVDLMDQETFMGAREAVEAGFADRVDEEMAAAASAASDADTGLAAVRRVDAALAKQGMPRSERKSVLRELKGGTPGAAAHVMPGADDWSAAAQRLIDTMAGHDPQQETQQ